MGKIIGTTGSERLWIDDGSGSTLIPVISNNSFGTNNYIFPLSDGTPSQVIVTDGSGSLYWVDQSGGTGGGAPLNATYVTLSLNGSLTSERVLSAGSNISIQDLGANGSLFIHATGGSIYSGFPPIYIIGSEIKLHYTTTDFNLSDGSLIVLDSGIDHGSLSGLSDNDHPQYIGQGILPLGSIPNLTGSYLPQGNLPLGSLTSVIPQGVIPAGSLINSLPQGILPVGSIPSLIGSYLPQGQLITGSLPNNIIISGSIIAAYGSITTNIYAGSFVGYGGLLTGLSTGVTDHGSLTGLDDDDHPQYMDQGVLPAGSLINSLPQGILPLGSIPNLIGSYLPQGQVPLGSLSVVLPQGVLPVGSVPDSYVFNTGDQIDGSLIIDETNAEAFLVRKNADGGDVLTVDTTNSRILLNGYLYIETDSNSGFFIRRDTGDVSQFAVDCANQQIISYAKHLFYNHIYAGDDPMYVYDTNDNECVAFDTVASAVNNLSIANAATGNGPELNAAGDDTDIDVEVNPKGTGGLAVSGSGISTFQEAIIINEAGNDEDTRIEGDTDINLLYIDAGNNRVGISTSSPSQVLDVDGNIITNGEVMGCREAIQFNRTTINTDAYLGAAAVAFTATTGYVTLRPGCIVGLGINGTFTQTSAGSVTFYSKINDTNKLSVNILTAGTNTYSGYATQARNTAGQTFGAGSVLVVYADFQNFVGTIAPVSANLEIVYDT